MNIFLIGVDKNDSSENKNEIIYSNIASLIVSSTAFIVFLVLLSGYGWIAPVYVTLVVIIIANLTLLLNYLGFIISSRIFLSLLPPIAILAGDLITLTYIPDGTHAYSFDVRILILASAVLPLLLFVMKELPYMVISLLINGLALFFFDHIHTFFGVSLTNAFGEQYYISTIFYIIAFSFIVSTLLIFKTRLYKLNTTNEGLLISLEEKVAERTQELEKNTKELIRNNNELEQFSFTVSHNVRGPVASLLGLVALFDKVDAPEQQDIVKQIQSTTVSLDNVISDLKEILEVRNNLYKVKEQIDIRQEIKIAQQLLSGYNQEVCCSKSLELDIKENEIFCVRAYIQSVLYNLIGNAMKYKQEDVDLKLKISTRLKGRNILLNISDNGRGIDLDQFGDKVFKMYSRFDMKTQGKGLGLYLVKRQVETMGGSINIKSEVNKGTTFSIKLPIQDFSKIENQVYYENNIVSFVYNGVLNTSVVSWKRKPSSDEFRDILSKNVEMIAKHKIIFWVNNTTHLGSVSEEDHRWFNDEIFPRLINNGNLKGIIVINKEGKGFKSSLSHSLKGLYAEKGVLLAFVFSIEEANTLISSSK